MSYAMLTVWELMEVCDDHFLSFPMRIVLE